MFLFKRKKFLARFLLSLMLVSSFSGKTDFLDKNTHRISYAETDTEGVNNGGSNSNSDKKNEVVTENEKISDPSKQDGYEKD